MPTPLQPAPPPAVETARTAALPRADGHLLRGVARRFGSVWRDTFDWLDVRTMERPRLRRLVARVRAVARGLAGAHAPVHEPSELRAARALGSAPAAPASPEARLLIMSFRAWPSHVAFELLLGYELRRRRADATYLVCGGGLPRSELGRPRADFPDPCLACTRYVTEMLGTAGFRLATIDALVGADEREELSRLVRSTEAPGSVVVDGLELAPLVVRSTLWVARSGLAARNLEDRLDFREFLESAAIVTRAFGRLLDAERPDAVVMVSGLFFAEAIMAELADRRGIRVVTYDFPGRPGTVFASDSAPASFYMIEDLWAARGDRSLTPAERDRVLRTIGRRRTVDDATWSSFRMEDAPVAPRATAHRRLALFTNVSWDTAVTLRDVGFRDIYDWVETVVGWALEHEDVHLDVRVHPGEIRVRGFESSDSLADFIRDRFPELPARIAVYPPESDVDSYMLLEQADAVLVYTSTIGLEAVVQGKPVMVAADVHYRGKGFTVDVAGSEELLAMLDRLDGLHVSEEQREAAIAYANLFFFEAMPEVTSVTDRWRGKPAFHVTSGADLADDPGIKRVCDLALGVRSA